jgi:hypothetical protein
VLAKDKLGNLTEARRQPSGLLLKSSQQETNMDISLELYMVTEPETNNPPQIFQNRDKAVGHFRSCEACGYNVNIYYAFSKYTNGSIYWMPLERI